MREKRKKARRRRIGLTILLILLLLAALGVVMAWKVFVVKDVEVTGNEIYSDEQIREWALEDEYSWSSLYVFFKYKFSKQEDLPFVDSIEVSLKSPQTIEIAVEEKKMLGYFYVPSLGQNAYFDQDGFVVEISGNVIDGVTKITGIAVEEAVLYEKLSLEDDTLLSTLLSVTQLLEKYELEPEVLLLSDTNVILSYGEIQVNLGGSDYLNEKILRMNELLAQLEGQSGTLHLENWTKNSTDVYFKTGELTELPDDVQKIQGTEE